MYIYIQKLSKLLSKKNMLISMSRKGNPIDNAPVESFFSLLKKEVLYNNKFNSM